MSLMSIDSLRLEEQMHMYGFFVLYKFCITFCLVSLGIHEKIQEFKCPIIKCACSLSTG